MTSMKRYRSVRTVSAALTLVVLGGLGCGSPVESYIHPNVDFAYMKRAAILPFQNLSTDLLAGERLQSIFLMEVLRENALGIVDPRETAAAMKELKFVEGAPLTADQAVTLGKKLGVDALFFGSVEEYGYGRGDRGHGPEVTAVFGMTETETGVMVWRCQTHANGSSIWGKLFGGGPHDMYDVSRKAVDEALETLF
jgi:hypothetical protein